MPPMSTTAPVASKATCTARELSQAKRRFAPARAAGRFGFRAVGGAGVATLKQCTARWHDPRSRRMPFSPEYIRLVLNEQFEDAKTLVLDWLLEIHEAHLVMLV